jgi:hypothetical protein
MCDRRIHKSSPWQRRFYLREKTKVVGSLIWVVGGLTEQGDVLLC